MVIVKSTHLEQAHTLYFALDYDCKPWAFNVGIGRGPTGTTDRWTLKTIIEIPFDQFRPVAIILAGMQPPPWPLLD